MEAASNAPLFDWCKDRGAGVLLHPTSFPTRTGIGNLGGSARRFLKFLKASGMRYWQICPLGPTGFGDSPYQSFSSFAGNPYLIDWKPLIDAKLLDESDLGALQRLPWDHVDYGQLFESFWPVLQEAATRYLARKKKPELYGDLDAFYEAHRHWLEPYAWFMVLKKAHFGGSWDVWPTAYQSFEKAKKAGLPTDVPENALLQEVFYQYLFWGQWTELKHLADELGIQIIGDLPIFVSYDSSDLWANPQWFQVSPKTKKLKAQAGVPPDFFSADGQLWGNPLYDWNALQKDGFQWWIERLKSCFELYDIVRIDHFRAFHDYWKIPVPAESARDGKWVPGPGFPFFQKVKAALPDARIIAEDLGELSPGVEILRQQTGLPGMEVLQFAFDNPQNIFLPHNHQANCVVYSGTHDNDTTLGWYHSTDETTRDFFRRYLRVDGSAANWDLIRTAYESVSRLAIIPLQDLLSLGSEARFNTPGSGAGNWVWRYHPQQLQQLEEESGNYLRELSWIYDRAGESRKEKGL